MRLTRSIIVDKEKNATIKSSILGYKKCDIVVEVRSLSGRTFSSAFEVLV